MAPNLSESAPNNLISRKYFTGVDDISVFIEELNENILVNKIAEADSRFWNAALKLKLKFGLLVLHLLV